jgi:hypothetical protein
MAQWLSKMNVVQITQMTIVFIASAQKSHKTVLEKNGLAQLWLDHGREKYGLA